MFLYSRLPFADIEWLFKGSPPVLQDPRRTTQNEGQIWATQETTLGPDLWNAPYNSLQRVEMLDESHLDGCEDDFAALVTAYMVEQAQRREWARIRRWMIEHGFSLALKRK